MLTSKIDEFWIGASDLEVEDTFKWATTQSLVDVNHYKHGEPHHDNEKNCLEVDSSGKWIVEDCKHPQHYICEKL